MNEQTQPTDAELMPCPFCGTQPDECDIGQFVVECPSCAIVGPASDNSTAARRAWNTRWGTPAGAEEVVAWLSTDSIGERYLCFTKPKDTDPARPLVFGDTTPQPTQAQAGAVPNWQDISTAPKDGTRFVAVGQNYGLYSETQHTCIAQWLAGCWVEVSDWNGASKLKYLTHWMPLPPLPCSAARKQGEPHDYQPKII